MPELDCASFDEDKKEKDSDKEDKTEDLNAQTIKPTKSPGARSAPLAVSLSEEVVPAVEDYSDLAPEEDEQKLQEKVANFKVNFAASHPIGEDPVSLLFQMKNPVRKGLFHPDDIKTVGITAPPGPFSAPVPGLSQKLSRPNFRLTMNGNMNTYRSTGSGGSGSVGRTDAKKIQNNALNSDLEKFDKYAEEDDEDYEDVFGKPNGASEYSSAAVIMTDGSCLFYLYADVEPSMQSLKLNTWLSNKSCVCVTRNIFEGH